MGPWYLTAQLKVDVANILKEKDGVAALAPYWEPLCAQAQDTAYSDLSEILLGKGYTIAQLDAWDNRAVYSRQQALFWLYTETALGLGMDDKEISKLDRRESLRKGTTITIAGVAVAPLADNPAGGIGGGLISETGYRITGSSEF